MVQAWVWLRLRQPAPRPVPGPLSVVVAAHNEEQNLPRLFESLAYIEYEGQWEIILVLDRCTDASAQIARQHSHQLRNLRILEVHETPAGVSPKKHALAAGIRAAAFDRLLFTDADCEVGPHWLREVDRHVPDDKELVLGLGPYRRAKGLLNLFIQYETLLTGTQYIALASLGMPYMAVGRNLAYRRIFFDRADEFSAFRHRLSGDDDLPVNHFGKRQKLAVLTTRASLTWSTPPATLRGWIRQKLRHFSAAPAYTLRSKVVLALLHGCHAVFYISLFGAFFLLPDTAWVAGVWCGRSIAAMALLLTLPTPWRDRRITPWFPLLDLLWFVYYLLAGPVGILTRPTWKKR
jgi:cellulose synthase/poly-beta-1,6-N-acetylglucosamine synthase-like glycosyltransferase